MRIGYIVLGLFLLNGPVQAQLKKTLHKVFEVPEPAHKLVFNIYDGDSYDIIPWAGNTIMVETHAEMHQASRGVFDFFLKEGRYDFITRLQSDSLIISSKDLERRVIRLEDIEALERVHSRIYIPDSFSRQSPTVWERPEANPSPQPGRQKPDRDQTDASRDLQYPTAPPSIDSTGTIPSTQKNDNG